MFGFRRLMYTILSRRFWIGIGIGFFLGGIFCFTNSAHAFNFYADDGSNYTETGSFTSYDGTGSVIGVTDQGILITFQSASTYWNTHVANDSFGITLPSTKGVTVTYDYSINTSNSCRLYFYNRTGSTNTQLVQTYINLPAGTGSGSTNLTHVSSGVMNAIRARSTNTTCSGWVLIKSVVQTDNNAIVYYKPTPIGGGGSDIYYPVLLFNDDMNIASTTCTLSATASDCLLHYDYSTEFSLTNIVLLTLLFAIGTMFGFWIVRTFW